MGLRSNDVQRNISNSVAYSMLLLLLLLFFFFLLLLGFETLHGGSIYLREACGSSVGSESTGTFQDKHSNLDIHVVLPKLLLLYLLFLLVLKCSFYVLLLGPYLTSFFKHFHFRKSNQIKPGLRERNIIWFHFKGFDTVL